MRPLAIISIYNEADILPAVLRHLEQQGCDVYIIDNWSTDLTPELLAKLGDNVERWPAERPTTFELSEILTRVEEIALERGKGRWVINHDADEIRRAPWAGFTLAKALEVVTNAGYNAVQFKVRTFVPTDNLWKAGADPERHFRYYRPEHVDHGLPHIKAWIQGNERVDLHSHGGHQTVFSNRKVCPHAFMLKHYPIRSQEHGERKVLKERFPRFSPKERSKQWHVQYDEYVRESTPSFISKPEDLCKDRNDTTIVTIARSAEQFSKLADSIEKHDPSYRKIVVTSGGVTLNRPGWEEIQGVERFALGRNLNLGITAAGTDDVLFVREDVEFVAPMVEELSDVSHFTSAAIVAPQVITGFDDGVTTLPFSGDAKWKQTLNYVPFTCVLLRRAVLDAVGRLDEAFSDYGGEEVEFGSRVIRQGLPLVVSQCCVRRDDGMGTHSSSLLPLISSVAHPPMAARH